MSPGTRRRRVGAGLSVSPMAAEAAGEAAREARAALGAGAVDLAFLFLSPDHFAASEDALAALEAELAPRHLLGCVAEGVVAGHRELENGPAAAVWAASLPEAEVETFHSVAIETDEPNGISVHAVAPDLAEVAASQVDAALTTWADCLKANRWPSYPALVHYATAPGWFLDQHDTKLINKQTAAQYDPR